MKSGRLRRNTRWSAGVGQMAREIPNKPIAKPTMEGPSPKKRCAKGRSGVPFLKR